MKYNYEFNDIVSSLRKVGLKKGDQVFIHSNLGFFGRLKNAKTMDEYCKMFFSAFFDVIGDEGTLIVPTFSYSFCNGSSFDVKNTLSTCGSFSQYILDLPNSIRSIDANFSVTAIGKNAKFFTENADSYSFGENSFWKRFLDEKGVFCNLNFDSGSTMIHYIERKIGVFYRYDKGFSGEIIDRDKSYKKTFYHYVYDLEKKEHMTSFDEFHIKCQETGIVSQSDLGKGKISLIKSNDMFDLIKENYQINKNFLIKGQ